MQINLYITSDEKNVIEKRMSLPYVIEGSLKNESSVVDPTIVIRDENPINYNYCYIESFRRYYFITNMRSIRNNVWELYLHVDVLMSYKEQIKQCPVILETSEQTGVSPYVTSDAYQTTVKTKTDIISFSSGLSDNGEYILITAGG